MRPYGVRDTGGGVLGYTDTGTGTPLGVPIKTVRSRTSNTTTVTNYFLSKQSAQTFIDNNYPLIDTPLSNAMGALTGESYILSKSIDKIRKAINIPKSFLGSEVLASAGAAELASSSLFTYTLSVYLYNNWQTSKRDTLLETVGQMNTNRVAVSIQAWDTGSFVVGVRKW